MWLESITVRTPALSRLSRDVPVLLQQLLTEATGAEVTVFVRRPANSDLSFHLIRSEGPAEVSSAGLHQAEGLRAFGTVDHSIWRAFDPRAASETPASQT